MSDGRDPKEPTSDVDPTDDEMFSRRERSDSRRQSSVSDFVRRAFENRVGSGKVSGSLSRDALQYLLQQGDRGKREVVRIVAHEVGDFLKHMDIASEVLKVLTNLEVNLDASIRFRRTEDGGVRAEVKPEVGVSVVEGHELAEDLVEDLDRATADLPAEKKVPDH